LKQLPNLKESEKIRLDELLSVNKNLAAVYILKDELKSIWQHTDRQHMLKALED
jgi:hypothetical protein